VIRGTELPDELIGIGGSHHETVPMCPGANDNATGIALFLELARFFQNNPQKRSILLLANGGEESGCWGTGSFVETNRDWLQSSLKAMLMVDQMGASEPTIFSGGTRWLEDMLIEQAAKLGYRLTHCFDPLVLPKPEFIGDPLPFVQAGFPTANIGGWPSDRFYHTEGDTPDQVNPNGVKAVADVVASLAMQLASR
jgi:aminopeptidase YwaD